MTKTEVHSYNIVDVLLDDTTGIHGLRNNRGPKLDYAKGYIMLERSQLVKKELKLFGEWATKVIVDEFDNCTIKRFSTYVMQWPDTRTEAEIIQGNHTGDCTKTVWKNKGKTIIDDRMQQDNIEKDK